MKLVEFFYCYKSYFAGHFWRITLLVPTFRWCVQKMPSSGVLLYVVEMVSMGTRPFFSGVVSTFVIKHLPRKRRSSYRLRSCSARGRWFVQCVLCFGYFRVHKLTTWSERSSQNNEIQILAALVCIRSLLSTLECGRSCFFFCLTKSKESVHLRVVLLSVPFIFFYEKPKPANNTSLLVLRRSYTNNK